MIYNFNFVSYLIFCTPILINKDSNAAFCVASCLRSFVNNAEEIINLKEYLYWQHNAKEADQLVPESDLKNKIETMCRSYSSLKRCANKCYIEESTEINFANGFAKLEDICQVKYKEILNYLPCLAKNERAVTKICSKQANETAEAMDALQKATKTSNFSVLNILLVNLCKSTNDVLICMTPVTERLCGRNPSELFKTLVNLGFKNTEIIYTSLGFDKILPEECKTLGKEATIDDSFVQSSTINAIRDITNDNLKDLENKGTSSAQKLQIYISLYVLCYSSIWITV